MLLSEDCTYKTRQLSPQKDACQQRHMSPITLALAGNRIAQYHGRIHLPSFDQST